MQEQLYIELPLPESPPANSLESLPALEKEDGKISYEVDLTVQTFEISK